MSSQHREFIALEKFHRFSLDRRANGRQRERKRERERERERKRERDPGRFDQDKTQAEREGCSKVIRLDLTLGKLIREGHDPDQRSSPPWCVRLNVPC